MPTFTALLLKVEENSNPEDALVAFEAKTKKAAQERAEALVESDLSDLHLGWRSYADTGLWGKPQRAVLSVEEWDGRTAEGQRAPRRLE